METLFDFRLGAVFSNIDQPKILSYYKYRTYKHLKTHYVNVLHCLWNTGGVIKQLTRYTNNNNGRFTILFVADIVWPISTCGRYQLCLWPIWSSVWPIWLWPISMYGNSLIRTSPTSTLDNTNGSGDLQLCSPRRKPHVFVYSYSYSYSYIRIKNQLTYRNRAKYMLDKMHYERHTYKS